MKIGIDAKWYFEGPPSGKRVVRGLWHAMLDLDDDHEYFIFLNRRHRHREFPVGKKRVTKCYVWAGNNLLSNVFVLPWYSYADKLDAILYQNFVSPFGRDYRVAYIHDVLFLSNPEYYTIVERIYFAPLKLLTYTAHAIVTVSVEEKKRLLRFKFSSNPDKITVAHHGVDSGFRPRELHEPEAILRVKQKFGLPERFLLFVGRLNLRKNIDNLLRALPLVQDKSIPLVIVGADDWRKSDHQNTIQQLGIADRVIFTGAVFEDLDIIYSLATLFCFPSHAESFGLPPLEAMASGVPVVVSGTTSLPEVCGEAGTYVNPDDPVQIGGAIDNLLSNAQLYDEKVRLGLRQAEKFNWRKSAEAVIGCMGNSAKGDYH
ncbi:MAG: glycosyltransferase family 1 protein [Cytophagales bacterium]|nr:glycosyltransferase family 1 protein [Cytophagales bacterium]